MKKYKHSEITPELIYNKRRKFIKSIGLGVGSISLSSIPFLNNAYSQNKTKLTSYEDITTYNNYYEFGTSKSDPYRNSQEFVTKPWSVTIEGEVENPVTISAEEIISLFPSEERVYKLRCVEGWSMVIPWMGFSLSKLLNKVSIKNTAKFVEFESVYDPEQMKGQMDDKLTGRMEAIINSMTPGERKRPEIIKGSRKRRIALGSGTQIQDVNKLLKQFMQMQKMMKKMSGKGGMQKMMRSMKGMMPPGGMGGGGMFKR